VHARAFIEEVLSIVRAINILEIANLVMIIPLDDGLIISVRCPVTDEGLRISDLRT
jgi:hypothetical protein